MAITSTVYSYSLFMYTLRIHARETDVTYTLYAHSTNTVATHFCPRVEKCHVTNKKLRQVNKKILLIKRRKYRDS